MKNILLFSLIFAFVFSQEGIPADTLYMKMDTLLINQGQMLKNQEKILDEVVYIDPLDGKKIGIEVNPIGLLTSTVNSDGFAFRGGVSFFPSNKKAEIAFPIYYNSDMSIFNINTGVKVLQIDAQYRGFVGKHRNGFYLSSGLRYISTEGEFADDGGEFGLTFGIGYRIYGSTGWYWGTSIYGGRYLTEEQVIIEIELLKFGMLF